MAKHRLEQPNGSTKVAKRAVIAGSITVGSLAGVAGPVLAAPIHVPNVGTFEVPGVGKNQVPEQLQAKPVAHKRAAQPARHQAASVQVPNVGTFSVPGLNDNQVPQQFRPHGNGGGSLFAPQNTAGEKAAAAAESRIGAPYSYGAAGPSAFDCSGLVYWSYKQAGKVIPRDSYGQLGGGRPVSLSNARPGDVLIFDGGGHAGLYLGNGRFVHAETAGVPVKTDLVKNWSVTGVRRY